MVHNDSYNTNLKPNYVLLPNPNPSNPRDAAGHVTVQYFADYLLLKKEFSTLPNVMSFDLKSTSKNMSTWLLKNLSGRYNHF